MTIQAFLNFPIPIPFSDSDFGFRISDFLYCFYSLLFRDTGQFNQFSPGLYRFVACL